jgi:hypothetical protein
MRWDAVKSVMGIRHIMLLSAPSEVKQKMVRREIICEYCAVRAAAAAAKLKATENHSKRFSAL